MADVMTQPTTITIFCDDPRHRGAHPPVRRFRRRDDAELAAAAGGQKITGQPPTRWVPVKPAPDRPGANQPGAMRLGPRRVVAPASPLGENTWQAFNDMRAVQPIECRGCRKSKTDAHRPPVLVTANMGTLDPILERFATLGIAELPLRYFAKAVVRS